METINCILCGSKNDRPYYQVPDYLLERLEVISVLVKCQDCGLIYQNPRPSQAELAEHYPAEYEPYQSPGDGKSIGWLMKQAYEYGNYKRRQYVLRYKQGGRLLDIGCSTGEFLHGMQRLPSWELFGIEINSQAAQIAQQRYGLDVTIGTLEDADYPPAYFDAITLWDVLEHLPDPDSSLQKIHKLLKQDGLLVIRVPNGDSWDARIFKQQWAGLDAPRHLYVFNKDTLQTMLRKKGFALKHISCRIGSYPTFVLSLRFWLLAQHISKQTRQMVINFMLHPVSRLLSAPFFLLSSTVNYGPLITVTAIKVNSPDD